MTDTVESLRVEIDALRAELSDFKAYAQPVIDKHQPKPDGWPEVILLMPPDPPGRELR